VVLRHPATGERLYDTRDDVKRSAAGEIVFSGRADDTVKVRGFRVELGEIESAMLDCAGMTQAAVVVTDDREPSLVGFYTPAAVPARAVLEVLRDRLPPYMVPTRLIGLGSFPLTERSKLDRRRLLAEHLQERGDAGIENASAIEQRVADVWARALGHRGFELDSSFFEVGGTSLKTAVLAHRLREAFGLDAGRLRESFVYRFPTVTAMARALAHDGHEPGAHSDESGVLVTLRRATDPTAPPVFCVASAGGTLGAYQKFAGAIRYAGEVVGLRDPYVSAGRDPTESFDRWVDRYLAAVRERQAQGPYCLVAYSSAGAFGIEIAQRLRDDGHHVRLLALVDPLGIDGDHWRRYGWWVMLATHARPAIRWLTRLAGAMRQPAAAMIRAAARRGPRSTFALDDAQFQALAQEMLTSRPRIEALAALMELNTGLPIDLTHRGTSIGPVAEPAVPASAGASDAAPTAAMTALKARVAAVMPEVDPDTIERIAKQYKLQLDAQRAYRMRPYDGAVLLVEPASTYSGLLRWQFRPHVRSLRTVTLDLDAADEGTAALTRRFGPWAPHFRCMRDGKFAESLAREVERALAPVAMP
jgi:thioesterase domain-containing protein